MILDQVDQEHQVSRGLGDPIPEKLAGVVQKYWQYKPKKLSVVKSLNDKFLIPSNCGEICDPSLNREIFCSKNIVPWVKRTNKRLQEPQTSAVKATAGLIKLSESILKTEKQNCG